MGKHCQLITGAAGAGKSTYCKTMQEYATNQGRTVHVANLDPAAEDCFYTCTFDVRDFVDYQKVMEECALGPNGGLVECMETLIAHLDDWFAEQMGDYPDDYLLFDLPGQIEIFTHMDVVKTIVKYLQDHGYYVCSVYLLDVNTIVDMSKFIAGTLMSLSTMVGLETSHVNVLSKCDQLPASLKRKLDQYCECNFDELTLSTTQSDIPPRFAQLTSCITDLVTNYGLVNFVPLDIRDEESIRYVLGQMDECLQYGDDLEPKEFVDPEENELQMPEGADGPMMERLLQSALNT